MPGSQGTIVDAVRPDGSSRWHWNEATECVATASPAVDADGTFYVVALSGHLIAIDSAGRTRWKRGDQTNLIYGGAPTLAPDGTIYVQDVYGAVYALRSDDGSQLWRTETGSPYGNSGGPALSPDGATVYVGTGGKVRALRAIDGASMWASAITGPAPGYCNDGGVLDANGVSISSPSVGSDGTVYVATAGATGVSDCGGDVDAFTPDGSLKWHYTNASRVPTTPALGGNGLAVVGDASGRLIALHDRDGSPAWSFQVASRSESIGFYAPPVIGEDGTVYAVSGLQTESYFPEPLIAVRDGGLVWQAEGANKAPLALTPTGVLYAAGSGGVLAYNS